MRLEEESSGLKWEKNDAVPVPPALPEIERGGRVSRRHGQQQRDEDDEDADEERVAEPADVERVDEQDAQVLERGRLVVDERVVGPLHEVRRTLEGRDEHPVEGEGAEDGEQADEAQVAAPGRGAPERG